VLEAVTLDTRDVLTLGGTDQTFNLLMAREIQRDYGQAPQAVVTHPLLVGIDGSGEKMSKSLGNTIGITEPPEEIYGKCMSISDTLMLEYFDRLEAGAWPELASERRRLQAGEGDPLAFKHALARRLVERFASAEAADAAAAHFEQVIRRKETPDEIPEARCAVGADGVAGLLEVLVAAGFAKSNSEARRLVTQGAVQLDGEPQEDPAVRLAPGSYLMKVGKRRFARITLA